MEKIKIKRIDSLSVFKVSFIICGVCGFIVGVVLALFSMPWRTTTSVNGDVIGTYVITNNSYVGAFLGMIIAIVSYFLAVALLITVASMIFNLACKLFGGLTIFIERE